MCTWLKCAVLAAAVGSGVTGCGRRGDYPGRVLFQAAAPAPGRKLDALGDPLPPGVTARLGTGRLRHSGPIRNVRYSPHGRMIASWGLAGCRIWDAATGRRLFHSIPRYTGGAFAPDGKHIAMSTGTSVHLVRLSDGRITARMRDHRREITWMAFAPGNGRLVTVSNDRTVRVWSAGGWPLKTVALKDTAGRQSINVLALSPDGRRLAVASRLHGRVEVARVLVLLVAAAHENGRQVSTAAEPAFGGHHHAGVHV
ncbi:hypothetical protein LCGC14_3126810, partial [marine sediment metagenome]